MKDRDDPRAALCVAVAAGRVAAIGAASVLSGHWPPALAVLGLACAICLSFIRTTILAWSLITVDVAAAIVLGLSAEPGTFSHIAAGGAAAQAGAAFGWMGVLAGLPAAVVAWWAPLFGVLTAGLARLWREIMVRRARAVQAAAAAERARLAREMHDSLSKTIDAIALGAAALPHMLGEPDRATRLAHTLRDGSLVAARDARDLIDELRSPAAFQLAEDIPRICREWTVAAGVPVEVKVGGLDLATPVAAELAWILREALRNTAAHARARRVRVTLAGDADDVTLTVEDDGIGLAVVPEPAQLLRAGHHGLVGMAERARVGGGFLHVGVSSLGGTRIAATVPRDAAPPLTGLPIRWRIGVIAAAAAGCGALIVVLSAAAPKTPPSSAAPLPPASPSASAPAAALPSLSPSLSRSPRPSPAPALSCHVKYAKQSQWKPGFVADITITNTGRTAIDGWRMTFTYTAGQKMTNGWNAIVTQEGPVIVAEAAGGNTRIGPNGSLTFGLQGTWNGRNPAPAAFVLNGVRCSTPY